MCFCVESGRLLSFLISKQGICVDPLKIEAIVNLLPPLTLHQIQSLQGKKNFLHRFIPHYEEITKVFIHLLKKGVPFIWDDVAKKAFEALKHALTHTSLLHPPNYSCDYFLYLSTSDNTIAMVLVQEDDSHDEHVIYYPSKTLAPIEVKYSHVEKLVLAIVQVVQRFRHYILLHKTIFLSDCNPCNIS
jgi:hypothetical protein